VQELRASALFDEQGVGVETLEACALEQLVDAVVGEPLEIGQTQANSLFFTSHVGGLLSADRGVPIHRISQKILQRKAFVQFIL
jgi:hypothetical protein